MQAIAYGAANGSSGSELYFANPIKGIFAVVEAFGEDAPTVAKKVLEVISHSDPHDEKFFSILQYEVNAALKDHLGKAAASFVLGAFQQPQKLYWVRGGSPGVSLVRSDQFVPLISPLIMNPRGLLGEEAALPSVALGLNGEFWEQGFIPINPGEAFALHSSGFPLYAPELREEFARLLGSRLPGESFQAAAEGFAGVRARGCALVLFEAPAMQL